MRKILYLNICCRLQFQFVVHAAITVIDNYAVSMPKMQNATDISTDGIHLMKENEKQQQSNNLFRGVSRFHHSRYPKQSLVDSIQKEKTIVIFTANLGPY